MFPQKLNALQATAHPALKGLQTKKIACPIVTAVITLILESGHQLGHLGRLSIHVLELRRSNFSIEFYSSTSLLGLLVSPFFTKLHICFLGARWLHVMEWLDHSIIRI